MIELTVCINTYNRWNLCEKAVHSVLFQEGIDHEVIIVDDCSSDPMPASLRSYVDEWENVRYIRHEVNRGLAAARNSAIEYAQGRYFSFCDDDDQWPQGFAFSLVRAADQTPLDVGIVLGFSEENKSVCESFFAKCPTIREVMLQGITPPVGSQLYRTELIRAVGGYDTHIISGVDHDLWISLSKSNTKVCAIWGAHAIVGAEPDRDRLTTVEERRRKGIASSLELWRPRIEEVFGGEFYRHFCRSYQQYLDYKFFVQSIKRSRYGQALLRALKPQVMAVVATRLFLRMVGKKTARCNLFPAFRKSVGYEASGSSSITKTGL